MILLPLTFPHTSWPFLVVGSQISIILDIRVEKVTPALLALCSLNPGLPGSGRNVKVSPDSMALISSWAATHIMLSPAFQTGSRNRPGDKTVSSLKRSLLE